jgi:hypothetical protein
MVAGGLVNSLARPGGNTTSLSALASELDGKRLEILIEAVPRIRHMAALIDSKTASAHIQVLKDAAQSRDVELSIYRAARAEEILTAIDAAKASGAEAVNVLCHRPTSGAIAKSSYNGSRCSTCRQYITCRRSRRTAVFSPKALVQSKCFARSWPRSLLNSCAA